MMISVLLLLPGLALNQGIPPGHLASGWSLDALEDQCSVEGLNFDKPCEEAILMDLGAKATVIVQRLPNGGETETVTLLAPDVTRATALMEQACGYQHWESCILYSALLDEGKRIPRDPAHARALDQWMCANGFSRACEWLTTQHFPLQKPIKSPVLQWSGFERGPRVLPKRIPQPEEKPVVTAPVPRADGGVSNMDKVRALLAEKCKAGPCGLSKSDPAQTQASKMDGSDDRQLCFQMMDAQACKTLGTFIRSGRIAPRSDHEAADALRISCIQGLKDTCP